MGSATTDELGSAIALLEEALRMARSVVDDKDEKRVLDEAGNKARWAGDRLKMASAMCFINRGYRL